jgi:hypothetical protein
MWPLDDAAPSRRSTWVSAEPVRATRTWCSTHLRRPPLGSRQPRPLQDLSRLVSRPSPGPPRRQPAAAVEAAATASAAEVRVVPEGAVAREAEAAGAEAGAVAAAAGGAAVAGAAAAAGAAAVAAVAEAAAEEAAAEAVAEAEAAAEEAAAAAAGSDPPLPTNSQATAWMSGRLRNRSGTRWREPTPTARTPSPSFQASSSL